MGKFLFHTRRNLCEDSNVSWELQQNSDTSITCNSIITDKSIKKDFVIHDFSQFCRAIEDKKNEPKTKTNVAKLT